MKDKKLSDYGITLLNELEKDRTEFHEGNMKINKAKTLATLANATSGALRTTLNCRKFEITAK
jgi:hypothetical protein